MTKYQKLLKANRQYEAAERKALAAFHAFYRPGTRVYYRRASRWRRGVVIEAIGFAYHHAEVRLTGETGRAVKVHISDIEPIDPNI